MGINRKGGREKKVETPMVGGNSTRYSLRDPRQFSRAKKSAPRQNFFGRCPDKIAYRTIARDGYGGTHQHPSELWGPIANELSNHIDHISQSGLQSASSNPS